MADIGEYDAAQRDDAQVFERREEGVDAFLFEPGSAAAENPRDESDESVPAGRAFGLQVADLDQVLDALARREPGSFAAAARTIGRALRELLGPCRQALVVGLGNREITPDAIGPEAVRNLIVTRHLGSELPEALTGLTSVAACQPGVLGQTGIESLALVKSAMQTAQPDVVIVIDALAAAEPGRLFRTVQLTDTGIVPGSGVGNARSALTEETLGVPVVAVGVPTVVDARTLCADLSGAEIDLPEDTELFVTPRDIDTRVRDSARLVGYAIDLALHDALTIEDIDMFLA